MVLMLACADEGRGPPGPDEPREEAELADMHAWGTPTLADPFPDVPADGDCPWGTYVEGNTFEADTGVCTYVWTEQPLLADLREGDTVELVFWHSTLQADAPAVGHVALAAGGRPLYEREVPIPADYTAYTETALVEADAEAGEPLGLHLHNHGVNTWTFLRVTRLGEE